jgi:small subunit ribosomal protein S18
VGRRKNDRGTSRTPRAQPPRRPGRPKVCLFCKERIAWVDYKDTNVLRRLMSDRGKIKARRVTGTCRQHQRDVATAIKTAREMALLPYVVRTASDRGPGRGGRGGGRGREQTPRSEEPAAEPEAGPAAAGAEAPEAPQAAPDLAVEAVSEEG